MDVRTPRDDFLRDDFKRPLIMQEDGSRLPYSRASSLGGVLESQDKLINWKQRQTAIGLARRPDLILAVNADRDNIDKMKAHVEKCEAEARSDARATIGTSVHTLTEKVDQGIDPGYVPEEFLPDLDAYMKRTKPIFEHLEIEVRLVQDELQVAGTADRVCRIKADLKTPDGGVLPAGSIVIGDLKTSKSMKYSEMKFSVQFAVYAHSVRYDIDNEKRIPWDVPIDQKWAVVFHVPAGEGTCSLYWVDIEEGWRLAKLSAEVKKARRNWDIVKRGPIETAYGATFEPAG